MLKIIKYKEKLNEPIILLLGYFDCMHIGHRKLLEVAKNNRKNNEKIAVFTFSDNYLIKDEKVVYTFNERKKLYSSCGIDIMLKANFNQSFKNQMAISFLNGLSQNLNIKTIVCGFDYHFGKSAMGDTNFLQKYCSENNINFYAVQKVDYEGEKASSSLVKKLLKSGDVERANKLLGSDFFAEGTVEKGRMVGRSLGFPTANIKLDSHKAMLKDGVYVVYSIIDGVFYKAIANYGKRPTFNDDNRVFEVFFKGYSGSLYGKELVVYFKKYIRGVIEFDSVALLQQQIMKDLENIND